ncbi:MAG: glycosyl hydrolase 53 family protein, partial [Saprospiraceae bacterium]|nr:glycosyl hydrolase 53 family protein [Saprospiraceae bacterium]
NSGFLWPEGNISKLSQMKELMSSGIKAVRDNNTKTKIMIHYAGHEQAYAYYNNLKELDYDIIGLSYYPFWHGKDLETLKNNLNQLATQFGKEMVIAETSYPFTFGYNDQTNNVIGLDNQILSQYPASVQGQSDFLSEITTIIKNTPKGIGFCYWAPEWLAFKGNTATDGSSWENQALWGFDNKALPGIKVFNE